MNKIKKGDIVVRKSHGKDIIFYVKRIIKQEQNNIAILCGIKERIEADCNIEDLEKINRKELKEILKIEKQKIEKRIYREKQEDKIKEVEKRIRQKIITGKILHLDGDRKYSQKSNNYYKKLGLEAIVKNIPEYRQSKVVYQLLKIYNPDILIITGHDRNDKKRNKL